MSNITDNIIRNNAITRLDAVQPGSLGDYDPSSMLWYLIGRLQGRALDADTRQITSTQIADIVEAAVRHGRR